MRENETETTVETGRQPQWVKLHIEDLREHTVAGVVGKAIEVAESLGLVNVDTSELVVFASANGGTVPGRGVVRGQVVPSMPTTPTDRQIPQSFEPSY